MVSLTAVTPAGAQTTSDPDPWFGRDKVLHFSVSAAIAAGTYTLGATQFEARYPPLLLGAGVTLAVGAGKEAVDALGYGDPSWRDFTWDVVGMVVGLGVAWGLDLLIRGVSSTHPLLGAPQPPPRLARVLQFSFP